MDLQFSQLNSASSPKFDLSWSVHSNKLWICRSLNSIEYSWPVQMWSINDTSLFSLCLTTTFDGFKANGRNFDMASSIQLFASIRMHLGLLGIYSLKANKKKFIKLEKLIGAVLLHSKWHFVTVFWLWNHFLWWWIVCCTSSRSFGDGLGFPADWEQSTVHWAA